jgi:hypothetical protein
VDYGAFIFESDNDILLKSGDSPRLVRGMEALMQTVLIEVLSEPGILGGGSSFQAALQSLSVGDEEATSVARRRLQVAKNNILSAQKDTDLPDDERLEELSLLDLRPDYSSPGWEADILVRNVAGNIRTQTIS